MKKISLIIVVIIVAIISSCSDYEANSAESSNEKSLASARISRDNDRASEALREFAGDEFQTTVLAEIQDVDGNPIIGAEVKIGDVRVRTDERGVAVLSNVTVRDKFAYVIATMDGYFDGSRAFVPHDNRESDENPMGNQVKIKLFKLENAEGVDSESGGRVVVQTPYGEGSVTFNPGFIDENGNPYSGGVKVFAQYIDPVDPLTGDTMPGDLLGLTINNEINVLGSFGMVNVILQGDSGEELQIASPAEIRLPIAPEQMGDAPQQIQTWYFSDSAGLWVEEDANGHKEGNEYVMTVNHFTYWNFDIGIPYCLIEIDIVDQFGNPLSVTDNLFFSSTNHFGSAPLGYSYGYAPSNTPLTYTATYSGTCGTFSNTISLGSLATSSSIINSFTCVITIPNLKMYNIEGYLTDCLGSPIGTPNGWVEINSGSGWVFVPTLMNGYYRHSFITCTPSSVQITGVAITPALGGTPIVTLTTLLPAPAVNTHNISNFASCVSEYIRYSIDGGVIVTDNVLPGGGFTGLSSFSIQAEDSSANKSTLVSQTTTIGFGYTYGTGFGQMEFTSLSDPIWIGSSNHNITFNLTNIGGIGMPIEVTFIGTFDDSSGITHTITGSTYILRDF